MIKQIVLKYLFQAAFIGVLYLACSSWHIEENQQQKLIPVISIEYIHVYDPGGNIFPGQDRKELKAGQYYKRW